MPLPQGMLANHTWHLVIQEGKQSLIRSCLVFFSFLKLALNHSSMKSSISRVNKTQIWSGINCVDYFLLLLECISYFSSTCLTSTCSHTLTHAHTHPLGRTPTHLFCASLCCCYAQSLLSRHSRITEATHNLLVL